MSSDLACDEAAAILRTTVRRHRRLDDLPLSPALEVRPAFDDELPQLAGLLAELVPGLLASFSTFKSVHSHSKSIYIVKKDESIAGCFANLHLNLDGLVGLLSGSLSLAEPEESCLSKSGSPVKAIYAWAWAMRPPTNGIRAMGNLMACLRSPEFSAAEIYARPTTDKGFGFAQNLDFRPIDTGAKHLGLWVTARFA